ncbi:hypothetical protein [Novosphingobium rosa]|uniref:hypothetical protein n=1 Tax=Novosphingobium rosa TaxID=76978 RepID=UPI0012EECF67|nr:hypothetical protein [Novosphingobium rosa]
MKEQPNASPDIAEDLLISDTFLLAVREGSSLIGRSKLKLSAALAELRGVPPTGRVGLCPYPSQDAKFGLPAVMSIVEQCCERVLPKSGCCDEAPAPVAFLAMSR